MVPRITIGLMLALAAAYIIGARYPGLAKKMMMA